MVIFMPKIAYFIDDHGHGHASRNIAIIRSLLEFNLETLIIILTSKPLPFIKQSLHSSENEDRIEFHEFSNCHGFIGDDLTGKIDHQATTSLVHNWLQSWKESYFFEAYKFLKSKNIDLIISDISPQPFLLAEKLDVPSIAISNFTWLDIYQNLSYNEDDLNSIWKAYREASLGLLLPFNLDNTVFRSTLEVSLVSRNSIRTRDQMRKFLDIDLSTTIIYAGTGASINNPFKAEWLNTENVFIIGGHSNLENDMNVRTIPKNDPETQDYISCSDIALIKFGYSSVSEAIRSHIPIIGVDFAQTTESRMISKKIKELGIGIEVSVKDYFDGKWREYIPQVLDLQTNYSSLPDRYTKNGETQISNIISDLLDEIG